MPVFRWGHSWDAFRDLEREMDRLLNSVNFAFQGIRLGQQFAAINLYELADEFLVTAKLPGIKIDDLEVTIAGGVLHIKGRRTDPDGVPEERYRRQERFRGNWQRSISVPDGVNEEAFRAEYSDGVLRIHLSQGSATPAAANPSHQGGRLAMNDRVERRTGIDRVTREVRRRTIRL